MTHGERLALFDASDLYVVITGAFCAGRAPADVLAGVLAAGVKLVQFREKEGTDRALYAQCRVFRELTSAAGALLIVDDRVDLALACEADGVHLGQDDLPWEAARKLGPDLLIGASTHNVDEALAAQESGASYLNIGPIFSTQTKSLPMAALGPEALVEIAPRIRLPWTCMGGITGANIGSVVARGARHIALVTAVTAAPDPCAAAAELRRLMAAAGPSRA